MNEIDLINQWTETQEPLWEIFQFWGSISFGLIAIAYLASSKLNKTLLISIISLYTVFSAWLGYSVSIIGSLRRAIALDLQQVVSENGSTSNVSELIIQTMLDPPIIYMLYPALVYMGTFFGCIAYLVYAYKHKENN
jgi:hypothetical protein